MRVPHVSILSLALLLVSCASAASLTPVSAPVLWRPAEFRLENGPSATNPFDPAELSIDATFTAPSGARYVVPAFWFQDYTRALVKGKEVLTKLGVPEWRVRFTATEPGDYAVIVTLRRGTGPEDSIATSRFNVANAATPAPDGTGSRGWVEVGDDRTTFMTTDGKPLRLIGQNVCWPHEGGTFDFDAWFDAMQRSGQNVARLWMAPWWAALEHVPGTLNRYRLDAAWQVDQVFRAAEAHGIYLVFCFEHHGMFQEENQNWGGSNNFWKSNPYNVANGGPCASPNDFFVNLRARELYEKTLRYLIGRYASNPHLLAWELFNEIDNVYPHLHGDDVAAWHRDVGEWMHAHDPFHHLVTTSLTGGSDRAEIWQIPELDFAIYHSYADVAPARFLSSLARKDAAQYGKPFWIGEFGTSAKAWEIEGDPHLRGFRQGLWGGAVGGSAGTAAPWWWEDIYATNANAYFATLHEVFRRAGLLPGSVGASAGAWRPADFRDDGDPPPEVADVDVSGAVFDAVLPLGGTYRTAGRNVAAIGSALDAARAAEQLNHFLRPAGTHPLAKPMTLSAWFASGAGLTVHVDSVSNYAELVVRVDGREIGRTPLPDKDGRSRVTKEYDADFSYPVPTGRHEIVIDNVGKDWVFLDHLKLTQVQPAHLPERWTYRPEAIGLRQAERAVVYVVSPWTVWPAGASLAQPPLLRQQAVTLRDWPAGEYRVEWYSPVSGVRVAVTQAKHEGTALELPLPDFDDDLAGIVMRAK